MALYCLFADGEQGAEVYGAASTRDQAGIVFDVAAEMVRQSPVLSKRCRIIPHNKRILVTEGISKNSFYRAIPAEAAGSHGYNASAIIFDELHVQPNRDLWDVLQSSTGARSQPMTIGITTAGFDRNSVCWELHEYARQVIEGTIVDPTWEAAIYAADPRDDWKSPATWHKANPSLGETVNEDFLAKEAAYAISSPQYENTFKRLYLNIWTQSESRFIPMDQWDKGAAPTIDEEKFKGRTCYVGLDISTTTDIAAAAFVFPPEDKDGQYDVVMRFFTHEEKLSNRRDGVPYRHWAEEGLINANEGNVVDFAAIEKEITSLATGSFRVPMVAVDRLFNAEYLAQRLEGIGIEIERKGQSYLDLSFPTKELLRLVLQGRVKHGGHPVLRWMADNLMVETDAYENVKPSKAKSTQKIDGIVALIMGLDLALRHTADYDVLESVY